MIASLNRISAWWAGYMLGRTYGEAILAAVEYVHRHGGQPAASLAAFGAAPYRRRLMRVLAPRPCAPPRWSWGGLALLLMFAVVMLPKLRAAASPEAPAAPVVEKPAEKALPRDPAPEQPPALVERSYAVKDLASLSGDHEPDLVSLTEIVTSTIAVTSWDDVGGAGTIREGQASCRLVIRQSVDVHGQIARLLAGLRRLPGWRPDESAPAEQTPTPTGEPPVPIPAVPADDSGLSVVIYPVRALLYADPRQRSVQQAEFDPLVNVIARMDATTWAAVGGPGSIALYPSGEALVVRQTAEVHERIRNLLRPLYSARPIATLPLARLDDETTLTTRTLTLTGGVTIRERASFSPPGSDQPPVEIELEKQFYPVGDLLRSELQPEIHRSPRYWSSYQIASWLQTAVAPESWKTFGDCDVIGPLGMLVITTTSEIHQQIERELDQVRGKIEAAGRPAALAALAGQLYPDLFSPRHGFVDVDNETHLYLYGRNRSDEDLRMYAGRNCKFLTVVLADTAVTDQGLSHLKELGEIVSLSLWASQVTDRGLSHLQSLTKLYHLDLTGTPITDEGLVHLQGLTKLQALDLRGTHVTWDGVQRLRQALPHCAVFPAGRPEAKQ